MSEYQFYEFQTVGRQLSATAQRAVQALSSHGEHSPNSAVFTYNWGSFKHDPYDVLARYFDAMLYVTNWGSMYLAFSFPPALIDRAAMTAYLVEDIVDLRELRDHLILTIEFNEEEPRDLIDPEGLLASFAPLRQDLLRGDYRLLYLAWLRAIQRELPPDSSPWRNEKPSSDLDLLDEDDDESIDDFEGSDEFSLSDPEPPVPPGLKRLTDPLDLFVDVFDVSRDLLEVAASASAAPSAVDLASRIPDLPESERNTMLARLLQGEPDLDAVLAKRLRDLDPGVHKAPSGGARRRTIGDLLTQARKRSEERKAAEKKAAEQARLKRLDDLARRVPDVWRRVDELIEQKQAKAYEEAIGLLKQLNELAAHQGTSPEFKAQIAKIRATYKNRPGLLGRLHDAHL